MGFLSAHPEFCMLNVPPPVVNREVYNNTLRNHQHRQHLFNHSTDFPPLEVGCHWRSQDYQASLSRRLEGWTRCSCYVTECRDFTLDHNKCFLPTSRILHPKLYPNLQNAAFSRSHSEELRMLWARQGTSVWSPVKQVCARQRVGRVVPSIF